MNEEIKQQLSTLLQTFNDKRVITQKEIKDVLAAIVTILAENKKGIESLNQETRSLVDNVINETTQGVKDVLVSLEKDYKRYEASLKQNSTLTRAEMEKAVKAQNDRAFKRLQTIISEIKLPQNGLPGQDGQPGKDGKDGSPDTAFQVRDKLETLEGEDRLDASAIKNLPEFIKRKGKEMLVGGIRFFEQLADVSILTANKRQDLLPQYNITNNRWEDGVAITVSVNPPTNPKINDLWISL